MVLITQSGPQTLPLGASAPDFSLPGTDGQTYRLASFQEAKLLVISFTCNHCPYAKGVEDRFVRLAKTYQPKGIGFLAISANDAANYPDDSFENMKRRAAEKGFCFPYLYDEPQTTAKAYGAVCTPHIFVFDHERKLIYEGRIDDNWQNEAAVKAHDLHDALDAALAGQPVPRPQTNPMGCSIKWK
ncbi:MAG TPA: thioredoxin family protein [Kiritimatiellia bacterium]|nr:thioredoxin family protein [Kiritimatiellia bacterium]HMO98003.1 thioredoxin family protein [Kiritimatiellia bacterium]HMP95354.1 thioredoxin family protein [Kiritimatiellia bacterium]